MNEANELPMMEEGVIPPLIELLRSLNERIQEHACVALRNLSMHPRCKLQIVQDGAMEPLVGLMRSPLEVIQEHTVVCIRNLSMALDNVVTIMENDALPPLIGMLRHHDPKIQVCTSCIVCACVLLKRLIYSRFICFACVCVCVCVFLLFVCASFDTTMDCSTDCHTAAS
jgi:hypothetical protein